MIKEEFGMRLVDENNFRLNYYQNNPEIYQYADRIMIFDKPDECVIRPLCYIENDNSLTWIKYGLDKKEKILQFIADKQKTIHYLLSIIEVDKSVRTRLHKCHQNPKMAHKGE